MTSLVRRFLTLSLTGLLTAGSLAFAEDKTYNVSGPVSAIDANAVTLTQGQGVEKFIIRRNSATQTAGSFKLGDVVRMEYFMTATSIAPKGTKTAPPAVGKIYHVSGPIFASDANSISLTQGKGSEKYVISRGAETQTIGNFKVGDVVRVGYYMTATSIGLKEAGRPGAAAVPVVVAPREAPAAPAVQVAPRVAPAGTAPATAPVQVVPAPAPVTRTVPVPTVVPPPAAAAPAPAATTTATPEAPAPMKKSRKTKKEKAAEAASAAAATAPATPMTPASGAAAPVRKTGKTKKEAATDATTSAAAPDAAAAAIPAKRAGNSSNAKAGDVVSESATPKVEAAPSPTPVKKPRKTKKQRAEEAAAMGTTPKRVAPKGIQPAEQMPVPTPTPAAK